MNEIIEVARYLKINKEIPTATKNTIISMLAVAKKLTPQKRVAFFDVELVNNGVKLLGANLTLNGNLATKHFDSCGQIIVVLATMGMESERLLTKTFAESSENAVVLDACLTATLESYLDSIEEDLQSVGKLTTRISCGYGDLALSYQKELIKLVNGSAIGVYINDSFMLNPNKSVIALIGVKNESN